MTEDPRCPSCGRRLVAVGKFLVCQEHGAVTAPGVVPARRVFLSYGHDEHASLARRIVADLRARGHDVWFDEERLQPGHDWEDFIERGVDALAADRDRNAMLLLLTPHAVRRPDGYCLNELARALARGVRVIPLMVVRSEPPLSICRLQWLDMRECIPISEREAVYTSKFERLVRAIEHAELDFEGTQQRLLKLLQPMDFGADLARLGARFVGRGWLFEAVRRWMAGPERVLWVTAAPGVGKSAFAAVLAGRHLEVAALHLCKFGHAQKGDPRRVVTSVAYQLATQLPGYERSLAGLDLERLVQDDASTLFDNLLVQPLARADPPGRPVVVLIDALDEAVADGRNGLASFLAAEFPRTPPWLRLIVTSRPDASVTAPLQGVAPLALDRAGEENAADVAAYVRAELAGPLRGRPDADTVVAALVDRSEGVFLYAERVCDDVRRGTLSPDRTDQFPRGLGGVYWQFFERQFPDPAAYRADVRPALRAVLAAPEPMPLDVLAGVFGWEEERLRDLVRGLGSLFAVTEESGRPVVQPYHQSLADWLHDERLAGPYFVSRAEGRRALGDAAWAAYAADVDAADRFHLTWLPALLREAGRWDRLEALLADPAYLERRVRGGETFALAADLSAAAEAIPAGRSGLGVVRCLDAALRREAHFVHARRHDYLQGLFQCVWNAALRPSTGDAGAAGGGDASPVRRLLDAWRARVSGSGLAWARSLLPPAAVPGAAQRHVIRGHADTIVTVAYSPDGRRLASVSQDGTARFWDAADGSESARRRFRAGDVKAGALHPDGDRFAVGFEGGRIEVHHRDGGGPPVRLLGHRAAVTSLAFSPDGRQLASASSDATVRVWDADGGGDELARFRGHAQWVTSVAWSPCGRFLASGSGDETARVWDTRTGNETARLPHDEWVAGVAWSPCGRQLATGSGDCAARIWDAGTGELLHTLRGHSWVVRGLVYLPGGRRLATVGSGDDRGVRLWDAGTGAQVGMFVGHDDAVRCVDASPDGTRLATGSSDRTVRVWDLRGAPSPAPLAPPEPPPPPPRCLRLSPNGDAVALGYGDGAIAVLPVDGGERFDLVPAGADAVTALAWSSDGTALVAGYANGCVVAFDARSGEARAACEAHRSRVTALCLRDEVGRLATAADDGTAATWAWPSLAAPVRVEASPAAGRGRPGDAGNLAVALSPDGRWVAAGGYDGRARVWSATDGAPRSVAEVGSMLVADLAFTPDSGRLVVVSRRQRADVFDLDGRRVGSVATRRAAEAATGAVVRVTEMATETVFVAAGSGRPLARVPGRFDLLDSCPERLVWAGTVHAQLVVLRLENAAAAVAASPAPPTGPPTWEGDAVDAGDSDPDVDVDVRDVAAVPAEVRGGRSLADAVADVADERAAAAAEAAAHALDFQALMASGFSRAERLLMTLYYLEGLTMREVGQVLDLSESRVSQMHWQIIMRLRAREFDVERLAGRAGSPPDRPAALEPTADADRDAGRLTRHVLRDADPRASADQ